MTSAIGVLAGNTIIIPSILTYLGSCDSCYRPLWMMRTDPLNCPVPDIIVHNALSPGTPTQAEDLDNVAAVPR